MHSVSHHLGGPHETNCAGVGAQISWTGEDLAVVLERRSRQGNALGAEGQGSAGKAEKAHGGGSGCDRHLEVHSGEARAGRGAFVKDRCGVRIHVLPGSFESHIRGPLCRCGWEEGPWGL